jgi:hypothetical protein
MHDFLKGGQKIRTKSALHLKFSSMVGLVGLWCLMPLSTIFQLYRGGLLIVKCQKMALFHTLLKCECKMLYSDQCDLSFILQSV